MTLRCTDHLVREHRLILRAVYVIKAMADQAKQLKMPETQDVEALLDFFRHFADEHHQTKEETILFPGLRANDAGKSANALRQMIFEHEQERSLIQALEEAMHTRNHQDFSYFANRMAEVLSNHIYKEDHILFSLAEAAISQDADAGLVREMVEFDGSLQPGVYKEWARTINRLEWIYLDKVA